MRQTIRLGRIAGVPIGVHWSVLVIMLLLADGLAVLVLPGRAPGYGWVVYWAVAVLMAVLFMAALLAHELAHTVVARHYGIRVRAITLWLLGGVSELDGQAPHARGDLFIALAGPLVSVAAAAVFGVAAALAAGADAGPLAITALAWLAVVNGALALFNLLPGAPLDGGRVLAAALWWWRGDRAAARRTAAVVGMALGGVLIALGIAQVLLTSNLGGLWLVLLGWFLTSAARAEASDAVLNRTLGAVRVGDVMTTETAHGYATQSIADFVASVARHSPHRIFPVLDLSGRPIGLVSLARLARVPAASYGTVRLGDVRVPMDRVSVLDPATPLADAAPELLNGGHRVAPVISEGRLCGVISAGDVSRAIELAALGATPDRRAGGEPRDAQPRF